MSYSMAQGEMRNEMVLWSNHNICFGSEIKLMLTHSYLEPESTLNMTSYGNQQITGFIQASWSKIQGLLNTILQFFKD